MYTTKSGDTWDVIAKEVYGNAESGPDRERDAHEQRHGGGHHQRHRMEPEQPPSGCLGNGFAWIWCSYVLAYLGREQIAETLSSVAVKEIIGVVLAYAIKSVLENLSKNNHWPDKPDPIAPAAEEETADQPSNDL